jgi:hypothetical protein
MLPIQIRLLTLWWHATDTFHQRMRAAGDDERGEITATTALIVILVVAAIAAGGIIAAKITANANNVPSP